MDYERRKEDYERKKHLRDHAIKGSEELDDTDQVMLRKAKNVKKFFEIQADAELKMMENDLKEHKFNECKKLELEERRINLEDKKIEMEAEKRRVMTEKSESIELDLTSP